MRLEFCSSCLLCGSKQKVRASSGSRYAWLPTFLNSRCACDLHDVKFGTLSNAVQQHGNLLLL